jgi:integron integrase
MGAGQVAQFLSHLALEAHVAASTQSQAFNALLFLYQHVLHIDLGEIGGAVRAKKPKRLPVVLTREEVQSVLGLLDGEVWLGCSLLYGAGLRLFEGLQWRVKDIDFSRSELLVRDGKRQKDRVTMLPTKVQPALRQHLEMVRRQHDWDLACSLGRAPLPGALARKYPHVDREWGWQWVFPAATHYTDRQTGVRHRFHLHETVVQKAVREAARKVDIGKHATPHVFRHASIAGFLRYPDRAGTAGPQGCEHDHELQARTKSRRSRGSQPPGSAVPAPVGLCRGDHPSTR